jgi:hypothetical protein
MKKLFNDKRWKPILILLGNIAAFSWIIFPGLTVASTFINMLTVLVFIALFLFDLNYVKETWFTISEEEKREAEKWKEHIMKQMEAMNEMHKQNESLKKKANPKQFDGVESDKPFVKTRNKTKKTK